MASMFRALSTAVFALALAAPAFADATKAYSIDTAGTTTKLKQGAKGQLKVAIKPAEGHYVSPEAPFKITLSAEALTVAKTSVSRADLDDPKAKAPSFKVALTAPAKAGDGKVMADVSFFLCNETICEKKTEKVAVAVSVTP